MCNRAIDSWRAYRQLKEKLQNLTFCKNLSIGKRAVDKSENSCLWGKAYRQSKLRMSICQMFLTCYLSCLACLVSYITTLPHLYLNLAAIFVDNLLADLAHRRCNSIVSPPMQLQLRSHRAASTSSSTSIDAASGRNRRWPRLQQVTTPTTT